MNSIATTNHFHGSGPETTTRRIDSSESDGSGTGVVSAGSGSRAGSAVASGSGSADREALETASRSADALAPTADSSLNPNNWASSERTSPSSPAPPGPLDGSVATSGPGT